MKRADLEHIIRAAGAITGSDQVIVVGSQSVLASVPNATGVLARSMEADLIPVPASQQLMDLIDGSIGECSPFHDTFGYYGEGVGMETSALPPNWRLRLVPIANQNTGNVTGLCLHPADMFVAKLFAWREKDREFLLAMLNEPGLIDLNFVAELIQSMDLSREKHGQIESRIDRLDSGSPSRGHP